MQRYFFNFFFLKNANYREMRGQNSKQKFWVTNLKYLRIAQKRQKMQKKVCKKHIGCIGFNFVNLIK